MLFKIKLFIYISLFPFFSFAQKTIDIEKINIIASRTTLYSSSNIEIIDSLIKSQNKTAGIEELLSLVSPVFVKSYGGAGGLASITLRGCSSNHTSVNWNGFTVNSLTTGDVDLSLFQSSFFENINIISGASASLFGSGTFGGVIELNNKNNNKTTNFSTNILYEKGSFGSHKYFLDMNTSSKLIQYKLSFHRFSADNNFMYIDRYKADAPVEYRKHNSYKNLGIMQNLFIKLPSDNNIDIGFWCFTKNKKLPEIAGSYGISNKEQEDKSLKLFIRLNKKYDKSRISIGSAFFNDKLHYTDKINPEDIKFYIDSEINCKKIINDFSFRYLLSDKLNAELGGIINYLQAEVNSYDEIKDEINYAIFAAGRFQLKNFTSKISFRTEFSEFIQPQYLFSIGLMLKTSQKVNYKINISNKFRRPTFNERYWKPGGDKNILSETGITGEIGLDIKLIDKKQNLLKYDFSIYANKINNMIQWIPVEGVWSAVNNKTVISRGVENRIKYKFSFMNVKYQIITSYYFTLSTLEKVFNISENTTGKQLTYVPKHISKTNLNISYKKINSALSWAFTGKRFTTGDNAPEFELPAFNVFNFYSLYNFNYKKYNISTGIKITNIFNKSYEIMKSYPVPGRAFYFNIGFSVK